MNNIAKEIKTQVKNTLKGALADLESVESLNAINDVLSDTGRMCRGVTKMCEDDIMDATLDATQGNWSDLCDKLECDDC